MAETTSVSTLLSSVTHAAGTDVADLFSSFPAGV